MDKEFVIGMIFEKIDTKKISGKANDFPTQPEGDYDIPLLTAGIENQGLARYAMRSQCPTILSNVISVSANGAIIVITSLRKPTSAPIPEKVPVKSSLNSLESSGFIKTV